MCDYSLAGMPNRLAVEGENLMVHRFSTGSIGLASPGAWESRWWSKQTPAVCIPPGARLRRRDIPKNLQQECGVGGTEGVTFVQLNARPHPSFAMQCDLASAAKFFAKAPMWSIGRGPFALS